MPRALLAAPALWSMTVALLATAGAAGGCSARPHEYPPVGLDVSLLGCTTCRLEECVVEVALCRDDPECRALYDCAVVAPSGMLASFADCYDAHPGGRARYDGVNHCDAIARCSACHSACDAGDAGQACAALNTTPEGLSHVVDECAACAARSCAHEVAACAAETDCAQFLSCTATSIGVTAFGECARDYASGARASAALAACTTVSCKNACGA